MKESAVRSRLDPRNRQARVNLGDVQQRLSLHVQECRILGWVGDLENPLAPVLGAQSKVLIPLATQRLSGRLNAERPLGDCFGLVDRKRRGRRFQNRFGCGSASGLGSGKTGSGLWPARLRR